MVWWCNCVLVLLAARLQLVCAGFCSVGVVGCRVQGVWGGTKLSVGCKIGHQLVLVVQLLLGCVLFCQHCCLKLPRCDTRAMPVVYCLAVQLMLLHFVQHHPIRALAFDSLYNFS